MHSIIILKRAFLLITILYQFSLGYYTFYGLTKSYQEYFCKQRRADSPDFITRANYNSINLTNVYNFKGDEHSFKNKNNLILGINGSIIMFSKVNSEPEEYVGIREFNYSVYKKQELVEKRYNFSYKVETSYFNVECFTSDTIYNPIFIANKTEDWLFIGSDLQEVDDYGYITDRTQFPWFQLGVGTHRIGLISCETTKSPETCSLKQEISDNFYFYYIVSCSILTFLGLLCFFSFKRYLFLRWYVDISTFFERLASNKSFFCNPITGKQIYLKEGDLVYMLTEGPNNPTIEKGIYFFEDKSGKYTIGDGFIFINCSEANEIIEINNEVSNILKKYFLNAALNPSMCAVDETENHYMSTYKLITSINEGKSLYVGKKQSSGYVLDIKEYELKLLKRLYKVEDKLLKALLEHNWRFFGNTYSIKSLLKCLERRAWSRDRPSGVSNTSWKWYTSDFRRLTDNYGYNYKGQVNWKPSPALQSIENIDFSLEPIVKLPKEIEINAKPESMIKVCESTKVQSLKSLIMNDEQPFVESVYISKEEEYNKGSHNYIEALKRFNENSSSLPKISAEILKINDKNSLKKYIESIIVNKVVKMNNDFKEDFDTLMKPPSLLNKTQLNRIKKLESKLLKGSGNLEGVQKEIDEISSQAEVSGSHKTFKEAALNSLVNYSKLIIKIDYYHETDNMVKEYVENAGKISGNSENKTVKIESSKLLSMDKIFLKKKKNLKNNKKSNNKKENRGDKNKSNKNIKVPKKGNVRINKDFVCKDFESNLNVAVSMLNNGVNKIRDLNSYYEKLEVKKVFNIKNLLEFNFLGKDNSDKMKETFESYLYKKYYEEISLPQDELIQRMKQKCVEMNIGTEYLDAIIEIKKLKEEQKKALLKSRESKESSTSFRFRR